MIYCSRCKAQDKPLTAYSQGKNKNLFIQYCYCHKCNNEAQKKKYAKNRKRMAQYVYDSIKRHPEKQRARAKLNYAVRAGKIDKPDTCEHCNQKKSRIEGAHHDYTKPFDVTWLCTPCHRQYDKTA